MIDKHLQVVVRTTPAAWYFDGNETKGIDHDLLMQFVKSLDVQLEIVHVPNTSVALNTLCNPKAQLAIGLLTLPDSMKGKFRTSPPYGTSRQQLLQYFNHTSPSSITDLAMENIELSAEPAYLESLLNIKQRNGDMTNWKLHEDLSSYDWIQLLDQGFAEYTIADSHTVTMTKRFYPRIKERFYISDDLPLNWVFGDCTDKNLIHLVEKFFTSPKIDKILEQISERYYGHATQLDYPGKLTFLENTEQRLKQYKNLFIKASLEVGIDWKILAALSYQESHWNPNAYSPSGVEGLMMLTLNIAEKFGVNDRKDPSQAIRAGAHFLLELKEKMPLGIKEPDRTWFALAAYNSGLQHIKNTMTTSQNQGLNPLLWIDVRNFLHPHNDNSLENQPQPLNNPFNYVYNIRAYRDILAWVEKTLRFDSFNKEQKKHPLPTGPAPI